MSTECRMPREDDVLYNRLVIWPQLLSESLPASVVAQGSANYATALLDDHEPALLAARGKRLSGYERHVHSQNMAKYVTALAAAQELAASYPRDQKRRHQIAEHIPAARRILLPGQLQAAREAVELGDASIAARQLLLDFDHPYHARWAVAVPQTAAEHWDLPNANRWAMHHYVKSQYSRKETPESMTSPLLPRILEAELFNYYVTPKTPLPVREYRAWRLRNSIEGLSDDEWQQLPALTRNTYKRAAAVPHELRGQ